MNARIRCTQRSALLLVAALGSAAALAQVSAAPGAPAAATQPADVRTIRDGAELAEAMRLIDEFDSPEYRAAPVHAAQRLLAAHNADLPAEEWELLHDALYEYEYPDSAEQRVEARRRCHEYFAQIIERIRQITPPVVAIDAENDDGTALKVYWSPVPGALNYTIERRRVSPDGAEPLEAWDVVGSVSGANHARVDGYQVHQGGHYQYRITAKLPENQTREIGISPPAKSQADLLHTGRIWLLAFTLIICGSVVFYIWLARRGVELRVRKIAGLEAVDEAVGRATEMGRPILFVPGIQDMNDIQTVAGLIVLGRVGRVAAEHDALLEVPTCRSLVMTAAREIVQASCVDAGRPDAYDERRIYYTTDEQFGYVAAVTGTMVREKPATCFYMGSFYAESLILAETGNLTGSIQIAGTAQPSQLPFFVAACDYTLIGEEFFAASAYLSGEAPQLGSLKGQDIGKAIAIALIVVCALVATAIESGSLSYSPFGAILDFFKYSLLKAG